LLEQLCIFFIETADKSPKRVTVVVLKRVAVIGLVKATRGCILQYVDLTFPLTNA